MPVGTNGTVKAMRAEDLSEIGFNIILGNAYHLYLRPGMEVMRHFNGLHDFSRWNGAILTDSGGFQVFSLSSLRKITEEGVFFRSHIDGSPHTLTPEGAVGIQQTLNSDVQMQLDVCASADATRKEAEQSVRLSGIWLKKARAAFLKARDEGYGGELFSIAQGNFYRDLRKDSVNMCIDADCAGLAVGGLSVGEEPAKFYDYLSYTAQLLPEDKPHYVMGIGTPRYILEAIENGIDMFDCVLPTRSARNGLALTHNGPVSVKKEIYKMDETKLDDECSCMVCSRYSKAYLRHLYKCNEILLSMLLSYHNLYFLHSLVQSARDAIFQNEFIKFKKDFLTKYEGGCCV
jgi:queuine tRNA-ribosyltransferase